MKRRCLAEFFGTFALVFAGTGAIVINEASGGAITHVGIALTFGLIVLAMIYTFGEISGAHLNPAVTTAFFVARRLPGSDVLPYITSQFLGALGASGVLRLLFPNNGLLGSTVPAGSEMQSFILEFLLTFFLMLVILNVSVGAREKGITAGIVVGAVIGLEAMFAGPVSGASMNPARSAAPALVSLHLEHLWIYLSATTLGAIAAVPVCRWVQTPGCCDACEPVKSVLCKGKSSSSASTTAPEVRWRRRGSITSAVKFLKPTAQALSRAL
jgi:aquaporin NIP